MIAVDRTMTWDATGYGSHVETGLAAPATTWYFAEGSTSGDVLAVLPAAEPAGDRRGRHGALPAPFGLPPIETELHAAAEQPHDDRRRRARAPSSPAPTCRRSITATAPIVAERAMYLSRPGQLFAAGHESAGVTAPALEWFLAEGATGAFFDLFLLIANPNATAANVEVEYLLVGGGTLTKSYTVAAHSRIDDLGRR